MATQPQPQDLHFVLFPLMAPGHMIPMIDIARLLAQRGVIVTIITTPLNANLLDKTMAWASKSGLRIRVVELHFPCVEAGLPEGCENFDKLPSIFASVHFFIATAMLQEPFEKLLKEIKPQPNCLISDFCLPWTTNVAHMFNIPRILFHGMCCFSLLCTHNLLMNRMFDDNMSESERFVVPGLPDQIELTKAQFPSMVYPKSAGSSDIRVLAREAEKGVFGVVVNTFEELEGDYVKEYTKAKGKKVWCIGPVSLSNETDTDKAGRGKKSSIDEHHCLKWLDSWDPSSVVYACLGSLGRLPTMQMIELGLGLKESNRPFVWCIRHESEELKKWILDEGFEDRIKGRGLLIRGWAPQVLILSHPSIGVFLTHCGWNSTIEGVCAGVPLMTWPMFSEQFCNEKLVVEVLRIGERTGVEIPVVFGEEEKVGVLVNRGDIKVVIERLMDGGDEGEERRKRARELGEMAKRAIEEGGSSYLNITLLIQDIMEQGK
ncbi:hypothetical protein LguiB_035119 [Lonicera macranthoides]